MSDNNDTTPKSAAAKLFDIRVLIGGLFTLYGLLLIGYSFFTSATELKKAAGININLWMGLGMLVLGMLVLGLLFLLWARLSPVAAKAEPNPTDRGRPPVH
jgi:hypothetical protein